MNIVICDDCKKDVEDVADKCRSFFERSNMEGKILKISDPNELNVDNIDILLLDVKMPEINGIDIKNQLEFSRKNRPLIIFVTGYPEYSLNTHGRNVVGFLEKPVDEEKLCKMLNKCMFFLEEEIKTVRLGNEEVYSLSDIQYIFMDKGYTKAALKDGKMSTGILKSLSEWEEELTAEWFIRINRSYLVNFKFVKSVNKNILTLTDGTELKISRNNQNLFSKQYLEYRTERAKYA